MTGDVIIVAESEQSLIIVGVDVEYSLPDGDSIAETAGRHITFAKRRQILDRIGQSGKHLFGIDNSHPAVLPEDKIAEQFSIDSPFEPRTVAL